LPRDPFTEGLFPVCVATHDLGIRRLFDLATVLMLLDCRPGDRVLDLGAGSGFSSEMLARFGYRVAAVDPDLDALRNNRRRQTFDSSRIEGKVYVAVGIAERLPFADRSFDGAVGLNVLHHVPDLAGAISEIARVLRPGARFVGCEPGLDHLEDAESVRAVRESGENDRPFDVIQFLEIATALGFSRALLPATLHTALRLVPLEEIDMFRTGWHPRDTLTNEGVVQELHRKHAYAMLVRDGAAVPTSRKPGKLRSELEVSRLAGPLAPGQTGTVTAVVTNIGDTVWLAAPSPLGGFVTVGCKLTTPSGRLVSDTIGRTFLPADVAPDGKVSLEIQLPIPADVKPGEYALVVDLVNELVCWFSDLPGNEAHRQPLIIA
jgi:SAM-dependent methyltransferase